MGYNNRKQYNFSKMEDFQIKPNITFPFLLVLSQLMYFSDFNHCLFGFSSSPISSDDAGYFAGALVRAGCQEEKQNLTESYSELGFVNN